MTGTKRRQPNAVAVDMTEESSPKKKKKTKTEKFRRQGHTKQTFSLPIARQNSRLFQTTVAAAMASYPPKSFEKNTTFGTRTRTDPSNNDDTKTKGQPLPTPYTIVTPHKTTKATTTTTTRQEQAKSASSTGSFGTSIPSEEHSPTATSKAPPVAVVAESSAVVTETTTPSCREARFATALHPTPHKNSRKTVWSILRIFLSLGWILVLLAGNVVLGGLLLQEQVHRELDTLLLLQRDNNKNNSSSSSMNHPPGRQDGMVQDHEALQGLQRQVEHWKALAVRYQAQTRGLVDEIREKGTILTQP